MTAHKHAEMIKAKADNMELVTLIKKHSGWRVDTEQDEVIFDSNFEYFLCLPKHKDAVLSILNGGKAEVTLESHWNDSQDVVEYLGEWWANHMVWHMNPHCKSRIKPRKEKRWVAIDKESLKLEPYLLTGVDDFHEYGFDELYHSMHEIEVEV